jgi:hypothetical protein
MVIAFIANKFVNSPCGGTPTVQLPDISDKASICEYLSSIAILQSLEPSGRVSLWDRFNRSASFRHAPLAHQCDPPLRFKEGEKLDDGCINNKNNPHLLASNTVTAI